MRSRIAPLLPVVLALLVGLLAGSASAGSSEVATLANGERTNRGLAPYAVRSDLSQVAQRHAARMAARQAIWHNPNIRSEVTGWTAVGENVGTGNTVRAVHVAFMGSPTHRANILDRDYREIGVGVATGGDGKVYVVQVFRRPATATRVTAPAPRSRPAVVRAPEPAAYAPRPAVRTVAQVLAAHRPSRAGALPQAVSYTLLLGELADAA